jgi:hypothetical protein
MKMTLKTLSLILLVVLLGSFASAQTSLTQTTLSAAINSSATSFKVASATGITATNTVLYVDKEAMFVNAVNSTTVSVTRGYNGTVGRGHTSGVMVLSGPPNAFVTTEPSGACTNAQGVFQFSPVVNIRTGNQWLCSTVTGRVVPGWGNSSSEPSVTTAVASAAGLVTPSGPLFHITGALAITGFNIPVGLDTKAGGVVCAIPDGTYTTTAANNIALASTAVVSKTMCWAIDGNAAKPFFPSY